MMFLSCNAFFTNIANCTFAPLFCGSLCLFWYSNHLAEEIKAGYFTLSVMWQHVLCGSSSQCPGLSCGL